MYIGKNIFQLKTLSKSVFAVCAIQLFQPSSFYSFFFSLMYFYFFILHTFLTTTLENSQEFFLFIIINFNIKTVLYNIMIQSKRISHLAIYKNLHTYSHFFLQFPYPFMLIQKEVLYYFKMFYILNKNKN